MNIDPIALIAATRAQRLAFGDSSYEPIAEPVASRSAATVRVRSWPRPLTSLRARSI